MHDDSLPDSEPDTFDDICEFREAKRREHYAARGLEFHDGVVVDPRKDRSRIPLLLAQAKEIRQLMDEQWTPSLGERLGRIFQQIEEIE